MPTAISGSDWHYNRVRSWVQRPLAAIDSILTFGDNYTNSSLFGSLSFNGMKLATDERMWPQGKRGYAPEVRGVASSSARVVVKQLGKVIYETHVPPGPFAIDDLYNTRYQGDLQVEVIEANGKVSRFTVLFCGSRLGATRQLALLFCCWQGPPILPHRQPFP
jgi:outer membrane usher protein